MTGKDHYGYLMGGTYDIGVGDVSQEQREAAILTVCANATGVEDAREILRTLGLL